MFLTLLGFKVRFFPSGPPDRRILTESQTLSVRATIPTQERDEVTAAFIDPANPVQILILILSDRTTATSVNLQAHCHDMVFFDVPESSNFLNKCIGRIYRMGQKEAQRIWIITINHSYDHPIQAHAAKKYLGQIAGMGNPLVTREETAAEMARDKTVDQAIAEERALTRKCQSYYTKFYGQRNGRTEWDNVTDLIAKYRLPEEAA